MAGSRNGRPVRNVTKSRARTQRNGKEPESSAPRTASGRPMRGVRLRAQAQQLEAADSASKARDKTPSKRARSEVSTPRRSKRQRRQDPDDASPEAPPAKRRTSSRSSSGKGSKRGSAESKKSKTRSKPTTKAKEKEKVTPRAKAKAKAKAKTQSKTSKAQSKKPSRTKGAKAKAKRSSKSKAEAKTSVPYRKSLKSLPGPIPTGTEETGKGKGTKKAVRRTGSKSAAKGSTKRRSKAATQSPSSPSVSDGGDGSPGVTTPTRDSYVSPASHSLSSEVVMLGTGDSEESQAKGRYPPQPVVTLEGGGMDPETHPLHPSFSLTLSGLPPHSSSMATRLCALGPCYQEDEAGTGAEDSADAEGEGEAGIEGLAVVLNGSLVLFDTDASAGAEEETQGRGRRRRGVRGRPQPQTPCPLRPRLLLTDTVDGHLIDAESKVLCVARCGGRGAERLVAVGGEEGSVKLMADWPLGQVNAVMFGHTDAVNALAFHPTRPHLLLSVSDDRTCRVWDIDRRSCLAVCRGHHVAEAAKGEYDPFGPLAEGLPLADVCGPGARQDPLANEDTVCPFRPTCVTWLPDETDTDASDPDGVGGCAVFATSGETPDVCVYKVPLALLLAQSDMPPSQVEVRPFVRLYGDLWRFSKSETKGDTRVVLRTGNVRMACDAESLLCLGDGCLVLKSSLMGTSILRLDLGAGEAAKPWVRVDAFARSVRPSLLRCCHSDQTDALTHWQRGMVFDRTAHTQAVCAIRPDTVFISTYGAMVDSAHPQARPVYGAQCRVSADGSVLWVCTGHGQIYGFDISSHSSATESDADGDRDTDTDTGADAASEGEDRGVIKKRTKAQTAKAQRRWSKMPKSKELSFPSELDTEGEGDTVPVILPPLHLLEIPAKQYQGGYRSLFDIAVLRNHVVAITEYGLFVWEGAYPGTV
ncbi:hypothetical protein KIPB_000407 [Kipferlia bialata]|uniref:Uncharacterized protein n=1 Tax=Kipferlia bialata TaxID=797122 RepID=A0A9K3GEG7_9EUKA|nr:hypothetical protein KIPB_000407 [Kipferlia bialata]|eukprot:g407.t1